MNILPGGHYLGCGHTQRNYETAFWRSGVADYKPFETWLDEGGQEMAQRANARWKKLLREYEAPALDPGVDDALKDYIRRRKDSEPDAFV